MAFSLSAFEAFPLQVGGAQPRRAIQRCILHIAGTSADVDLDIGDDSGTFWTAAGATDIGAGALASLKQIIAQVSKVSGLFCPELDAYGVRASADSVVETLDLNSAASAGGNATETFTVTGLLTTDNIISVDIKTMGANDVMVDTFPDAAAANNQLQVTFDGDPGVGLVLKVGFTRTSGATLSAGEYSLAYQNSRPNYTLPAASGLTAYTVIIDYLLLPNILPVVVNYGIGG